MSPPPHMRVLVHTFVTFRWHSYFPHCTSERKSSDANYTYSFRVYTKDTMESTSDHALV
eukprot:m.165186 g.165186  ORF g.165186 m.165186 type:complete len:59 (+) comp18126_c0_seq10:977-1153(+)